ncbi:Flagellar biosynthesis protein FliP [Candidatus Syntrophocurvum alkaliphilum]|uniref:Flagellar biosynthetic protein FliP n=1 Tax=Candidatus Syntrophocurvum alkaliphilum TaxID=2293317 RepID=A0A6I6DHW4_9FIRM|nr:flagellar type III secretion system pore protein FliP [Candidatus Syntrophocurvum alkaliphilum]QGT99179.1 Flagellar biosynthesis protein FliP [Candidatus Syntrophocurvum alkaliphilum]
MKIAKKFVPCLKILGILTIALIIISFLTSPVLAQPIQVPDINLQIGGEGDDPQNLSTVLQLIILITVLALAPAILVLLTCFTRIIVVLAFIRSSLATQQMPPNQVLIGLALFLTFFVMAPTWQQVNEHALQPYFEGEINQTEAYETAMEPMRTFMFEQTREKDLALFVRMAELDRPENYDDIPNYVLIPAFVISELKTAFQIGFIIFVPFLIIDIVVASALMSMGMMMLPPMMISLPFKVLLFVLVDGWNLVIQSLLLSF